MSPEEEYRLVRNVEGWFVLQHDNHLDTLSALLSAFSGFMVPKAELASKAALQGMTREQLEELIAKSGLARARPSRL